MDQGLDTADAETAMLWVSEIDGVLLGTELQHDTT